MYALACGVASSARSGHPLNPLEPLPDGAPLHSIVFLMSKLT
jgi:hypothetical protein